MKAPRAACLALVVAAALVAGCGDDEPPTNALAWFDTPTVIVPPTLKQDRILRAEVRNDSDQELRLESGAFKVYDDRGRPVKASATFAEGYLHSLYPPTRGPATLARHRAGAPRQGGADRAREDRHADGVVDASRAGSTRPPPSTTGEGS